MTHTERVEEILAIALSLNIFAWKNQTGMARVKNKGSAARFVRFGFPGSPDILGLLPGSGRFIGIEIKIPPDKQSEKQLDFQQRVQASGGFYLLFKTHETEEEIRNILRGLEW